MEELLNNEEMDFESVETEVAATEESESFVKRNQGLLIGLGSGSLGLAGGFGLGALFERKKRKQALEEINKAINLAFAAETGEETIVFGKDTYDTIKMDNPESWKLYIMNDILKDTRMSKKEKEQWRNTLINLHTLSLITKDNEENMTIVKEQ